MVNIVVVVAFLMLAALSCAEHGGGDKKVKQEYVLALDKVRSEIPDIGQFTAAFEDAEQAISHFKTGTDSVWRGVTVLHGRFLVSLHVPIVLDRDANGELIGVSKRVGKGIKIYKVINEVISVRNLPNGQQDIEMGRQLKPSDEEWEKLLSSGSLVHLLPEVDELPEVPGIDSLRK